MANNAQKNIAFIKMKKGYGCERRLDINPGQHPQKFVHQILHQILHQSPFPHYIDVDTITLPLCMRKKKIGYGVEETNKSKLMAAKKKIG